MQLRKSTLLSLAFGAALIAAPSLGNIGADVAYDQAFAAKGGNGKGNGGGNAGKGSASASSSDSGKSKGGKSAKASDESTEDDTSVASLTGKKTKGPDHPSSLGRWNATKDFEHPSIQAHIRNGNFNGTIGLLARFGLALNTLGGMQEQAAAAEQASADLAAALQTAGYGMTTGTFDLNAALSEYEAAMSLPDAVRNEEIDSLMSASENMPSAEDLAAAAAELTDAEAAMSAASNKASWETVRSVVIDRLGLEDVTVTDPTAPTDPTTPTEPTEPAPVIEPVI